MKTMNSNSIEEENIQIFTTGGTIEGLTVNSVKKIEVVTFRSFYGLDSFYINNAFDFPAIFSFIVLPKFYEVNLPTLNKIFQNTNRYIFIL